MLARFTKLPVFSSLLSNTQYPQDVIDSAISEIKTLGKRSINGDESLQDIQKILFFMRKYSESIHIQRVACHALSNLAMQVVAARWIIQKGGFTLIKKCMQKFHSDHKLCWLASSAVWNLARPPANRGIIGRDGAKLMLQILYEHRNKEKVTNTAIGALSNLSLLENLKDLIAKPEHMELILAIMAQYSDTSTSVMTSGAGLVANLAVSDTHASLLVGNNALPVLLKLLAWKTTDDETLYRNTCAALNNLVTADGFLDSFLESRGIENILEFLESNENELYENLLENCLVNIDTDSSTKTTSYHLSAFHGRTNILKNLIAKNMDFDLATLDENNMTCLDYAIGQNQKETVSLLSKCGATQHSRKSESISPKIAEAIESGTNTLRYVRQQNEKAFIQALPHFPHHLCQYMDKFTSDIDKLKGMELY